MKTCSGDQDRVGSYDGGYINNSFFVWNFANNATYNIQSVYAYF